MKKLTVLFLTIAIIITSVPMLLIAWATDEGSDADYSALLGEETQSPAFTMDISAPDSYYAGEEVTVTVTVNNLNVPNGIQHVTGYLYFDTEVLGFNFDLKVDKELKNTFRGYNEWTSMSKLAVDDNGKWYIIVDAVTGGVENEETGEFGFSNVTEDGILAFDFTFVAKADAKGDTVLYIPHSTVEGDCCDFQTMEKTKYYGNGGLAILSEGDPAAIPTRDQPPADKPSTPSDEPSENPSEEPIEPEESAPPVEDEDLLGEADDEPDFTLDITAPKQYIAGKKVTITITVNNVNTDVGLQHVHGNLYFNPDILGFSFDLKANKELKKTFNGYNEWEGFSKLALDENGNWYVAVDAATIGVEDEETGEFVYSNVTESGVLKFTFTFVAKADAEGDAVIYIPHATVRGDFYHPVTYEHIDFIGNGSGAVIEQDLNPHYCQAVGDWEQDEKNHWKLCVCGDELEKAPHSFEWQVVTEAGVGVEGERQYACKDCKYVAETEAIPALGLKGDVNENKIIDTMDYIFLKRAYFGTFVLKKPEVGDINNNGNIDTMDYIFLKRAYFGTYVIK